MAWVEVENNYLYGPEDRFGNGIGICRTSVNIPNIDLCRLRSAPAVFALLVRRISHTLASMVCRRERHFFDYKNGVDASIDNRFRDFESKVKRMGKEGEGPNKFSYHTVYSYFSVNMTNNPLFPNLHRARAPKYQDPCSKSSAASVNLWSNEYYLSMFGFSLHCKGSTLLNRGPSPSQTFTLVPCINLRASQNGSHSSTPSSSFDC